MKIANTTIVVATTFGVVALALGAAAAPAGAQDVIELPGQDVALDADFAEVYRVGRALAGADWEQFGDVSNVGFDAEGNLYIFDRQSMQVVVVGPDRQMVRRFGRAGDGPGELRFPRDMAVMRDGRVVIADVGHRAYAVFGPDGEYQREGPQLSAAGGVADPSGFALITVHQGTRMTLSLESGGVSNASSERAVKRLRLDEDDATETMIARAWTLPEPEGKGGKVELPEGISMGTPGSAFLSRLSLPPSPPVFQPVLHVAPLPDGSVAVADSTTYAIKIVREGEDVVRTLARPIPSLPVTNGIKEAWRERNLAELEAEAKEEQEEERPPMRARSGGGFSFSFSSLQSPEQRRQEIAEREFYEEVPAVQALHATWNGRIWVQRRANDGDGPGPVDVLSSEGEYLGTYPAATVVPDAFGPDGLAAFIETGDYDMKFVRVVRLPREVN